MLVHRGLLPPEVSIESEECPPPTEQLARQVLGGDCGPKKRDAQCR